jgi:hypothetical protein
MQFTMVPLPMTAAEKFQEAAYFYNQMIATVNNTRTFPFNAKIRIAEISTVQVGRSQVAIGQ